MSLKVWLPLRDNLENKGISGYNINSTNATVNENGKIGKCIKIISKTSLEYIPNFNTSSLSFGGWFKFNKSEINTIVSTNNYTSTYKTSVGQLIGNSSYGGIGLVWVTNNCYTDGSFDSISVFSTLRTSTVNNSTSSILINFDEWTHIFLVWDIETHKLSLYKNGDLINSKVFSNFSDGVSRQLYLNYNAIYGGNAFSEEIPIYCNDIRIYDHALSKAEVKEISKALILHYKLDNNGIGELNSNIIYDSSGYGNNGTPVNTIMYSNLTAKYNASINFNKVSCIKNSNFILPGKLWSVTCWYYEAENPTAYEGLFCLSKSTGVDAYKKFAAMPNSGRIWYKGETGTASISRLNIAEWTFLAMINDGTTVKIYQNVELIGSFTTGNEITGTTDLVIGARATAENATSTSFYFNGQMSDFRIYATALSQQDIKELYHTSLKIDNFNKMHTFELEESGGRELIQGLNLTSSFSIHSDTNSIYRGYNENGEIYLSGPSSIGSKFIPISPTGKIYYYDIEISADSDNVHYIGFERYDAIKTSTSNHSCVYPISSSIAQDHVRYKGIIDLSTDLNGNPTAFIALRILNDWSNGTTRKMTIHHLSLREVTTLQNQKVNKNGILLTDEFRQYSQASFYKNGFIEATNFIER